MARPLRTEYPGAFYYVINRGNANEGIFIFKSILVDADGFLTHLSRYIHLNPVRANMVESVVDYPWSSYRAFIGIDPAPAWLRNDWLLSQYG